MAKLELCSINVHLRLLKADVEFLWVVVVVVVCKVIFMSNPTAVLRLCCHWNCENKLISHPKKIVVVVVVVIGFVVVVVVHVVVVVIPVVDPRNIHSKLKSEY